MRLLFSEGSETSGSWWWREGHKSGSPPQCGGPVNLVDEERALGQMTHLLCSINTVVQGRRGDRYRWPRNSETLGFLSLQAFNAVLFSKTSHLNLTALLQHTSKPGQALLHLLGVIQRRKKHSWLGFIYGKYLTRGGNLFTYHQYGHPNQETSRISSVEAQTGPT